MHAGWSLRDGGTISQFVLIATGALDQCGVGGQAKCCDWSLERRIESITAVVIDDFFNRENLVLLTAMK